MLLVLVHADLPAGGVGNHDCIKASVVVTLLQGRIGKAWMRCLQGQRLGHPILWTGQKVGPNSEVYGGKSLTSQDKRTVCLSPGSPQSSVFERNGLGRHLNQVKLHRFDKAKPQLECMVQNALCSSSEWGRFWEVYFHSSIKTNPECVPLLPMLSTPRLTGITVHNNMCDNEVFFYHFDNKPIAWCC